jgi:Flp pilus assembly protein TadG
MKSLYKCRKRESGQSLVEAALALPIVIMLMLGMLDLGRAFFILVELNDAADEGASYAGIDYTDMTGIAARAADSTSWVTITAGDVALTGPPSSAVGQPVTVTVSTSMRLFTPFVSGFVGSDVILLRGRATHPIMMVP